MPYLKVQTNSAIDKSSERALMAKLSETVATQLGKSERYVMIAIEDPVPMLFDGSDKPLAYLELKSIGLDESDTTGLSQALTTVIHQELGIAGDRIYIEFANADRHMWGWSGRTF